MRCSHVQWWCTTRASILALGIMLYISVSIMIQLLTVVHPVGRSKKEGESGRLRLANTPVGVARAGTFQSIGIATGLPICLHARPGDSPGFAFYFTAVVSLVTGTMFLMWSGEHLPSVVSVRYLNHYLAAIVAGLPSAIGDTIEQARQGELHILVLLLVAS
ncbi:hypothetical protein ACNKHX_20270 [Shigella flexneri]